MLHCPDTQVLPCLADRQVTDAVFPVLMQDNTRVTIGRYLQLLSLTQTILRWQKKKTEITVSL